MRTWIALLLLCLLSLAHAQAPKTVTLSVTDKPATEVAAELSKQLGFVVAIAGASPDKVSLELKDAKPEEAIAAFAKAFDASWLRSYFMQPKDANYVYTGDQYLTGLTNQRQTWFDSFTDEERQALFQTWFGNRGGRGGPGGRGGGPGGQGGPAPAAGQPAAEGAPPAAAAVEPLYTREQMAAMPGAGRSTLGRRGGPGGPGGGPGGPGQPGAAQPAAAGQPAPEGQPAGAQPGAGQPGGQGGQRQQWFDPVADVIIPVRLETVTLKADNADLQQTLLDFMTASGFITVASTDLTGAVTAACDKAPINDVLDKIAASINGKWAPVYLLGLPRVLSDTEVEARQDQRFQGMWTQYWAKPAEERAKDLQNRIEMITRWADAAKQAGQDGQQSRAARGFQRMAPRMLSRMNKYSTTLSMAQRDEIKPLMQTLSRALAGN